MLLGSVCTKQIHTHTHTHTHPGRQAGGWVDGQAGYCNGIMLKYETLLSVNFLESVLLSYSVVS